MIEIIIPITEMDRKQIKSYAKISYITNDDTSNDDGKGYNKSLEGCYNKSLGECQYTVIICFS